MTREELIRNLKYTMKKHENDKVPTFGTNISIMCKDILDYLEQEPCEDAISRRAVLNEVKSMSNANPSYWATCDVIDRENLIDSIKDLPSVKPVACIATVKFSKEDMQKLIDEKMKEIVVERKKGKWIPHRAKYDETAPIYECSICHKNNEFENTNYCPNCGCLMSKGGKE